MWCMAVAGAIVQGICFHIYAAHLYLYTSVLS